MKKFLSEARNGKIKHAKVFLLIKQFIMVSSLLRRNFLQENFQPLIFSKLQYIANLNFCKPYFQFPSHIFYLYSSTTIFGIKVLSCNERIRISLNTMNKGHNTINLSIIRSSYRTMVIQCDLLKRTTSV